MAKHVCPRCLAYAFDNPVRPIFHKPEEIVAPYLAEGMTAVEIVAQFPEPPWPISTIRSPCRPCSLPHRPWPAPWTPPIGQEICHRRRTGRLSVRPLPTSPIMPRSNWRQGSVAAGPRPQPWNFFFWATQPPMRQHSHRWRNGRHEQTTALSNVRKSWRLSSKTCTHTTRAKLGA